VTICTQDLFIRSHYKNDILLNKTTIYQSNLSMKNFFIGHKFTNVAQETTSTNNTKSEKMSNEFFKVLYFQYVYLCVRFNSAINNQPVKINRTDAYLEVNITNQYRQSISNDEYFVYKPILNLMVGIDDNYINSFIQTPTITLPYGKVHIVNILKSEIQEMLDEPYSTCKKSAENQPYRKVNCIENCLFNKIATNINCTLQDSLFKIDGLKECDLSKVQTYAKSLDLFTQDCTKECPLACESSKFTAQSSIYLENIDYSSNLTILKFTINDLSSLKITQIPKTNFFSFISADIGGALGLFMGISVLNFIEMFEFVLDIFLITSSF
jgi:hypothetical protein